MFLMNDMICKEILGRPNWWKVSASEFLSCGDRINVTFIDDRDITQQVCVNSLSNLQMSIIRIHKCC